MKYIKHKDTSGKNNPMYKHGLKGTRFYVIWRGIKARCLNPKKDNYKYYGGKGITICDKWINFIEFKDEMYESYLIHVKNFGEKDTTIDRINSNGDYLKENCRWATNRQQQSNRLDKKLITFNGETLNSAEWARRLNISSELMHWRLKNWSIEKSLTTKIK